jgi:hypothetical protein
MRRSRGRALSERWRVREPEGAEGTGGKEQNSPGCATGGTRDPAAAGSGLAADDLMHPLMRQAELLRDLTERDTALVELEHGLVVRGTA